MFEFIFFCFLCCFILLLSYSIYASSKQKKQKLQQLDALDVYRASHITGLPLPQKEVCELYLYDDKVIIENYQRKFEIPLSRITQATYKPQQDYITKEKSVIGRAIVGSLLSPVGSVVGAISGIGTKTVRGKKNYFLTIDFMTINGFAEHIVFLNNTNTIGGISFCTKLNAYLTSPEEDTDNMDIRVTL